MTHSRRSDAATCRTISVVRKRVQVTLDVATKVLDANSARLYASVQYDPEASAGSYMHIVKPNGTLVDAGSKHGPDGSYFTDSDQGEIWVLADETNYVYIEEGLN